MFRVNVVTNGKSIPPGMQHTAHRTTNDERRTTNDERRTTNDERRTTNDERRNFASVRVCRQVKDNTHALLPFFAQPQSLDTL